MTFVERQIAHLWAGSIMAIAMLFPVEWLLGLPVLELSPVLGLISGMVFLVKAGILSGRFYVQAMMLFLTAPLMAVVPELRHLDLRGRVGGGFFFPGLKYFRLRSRTTATDS